ncbi:MAG TPA: hypothetical protein VI432_00880 [Candidatus Paceibacterota bacterium]
MNAEKLLEATALYTRKIEEMNIPAKSFKRNELRPSNRDALAHCHRMLQKIPQLIKEGRVEKVHRWLGFIQACLWMSGTYSIQRMKDHLKPD